MKHFFTLCFITWAAATRLLEAYVAKPADDLEQGVSTELWTPDPHYDFGPEDLTLDKLSTNELKTVLNGLEELNEDAVGEDYYPADISPVDEWEVGVPENDLTRYFDKNDLDEYYQGELTLDELFDVVKMESMPSRRRLGEWEDKIVFDENGEYEQPPLDYYISDKPEPAEEQTAGKTLDHDLKLAQAPQVKNMVEKPEKKEEEADEEDKASEKGKKEEDDQVSQNEEDDDEEGPPPPATADAVDNVQKADDEVKKAKAAVEKAEKKKVATEVKEKQKLDKMSDDLNNAKEKLEGLKVKDAEKEETAEDKKLQGLNDKLEDAKEKLDSVDNQQAIDPNPALTQANAKRKEMEKEKLKRNELMDKMRAAQKDLETQDQRLVEKKKEAANEAIQTAERLQKEANDATEFAKETNKEVDTVKDQNKNGDQPAPPEQEEDDDTDNDGIDDENPSKTPPEDQDQDDDEDKDNTKQPPGVDEAGDEDEDEDDEKAGPKKDQDEDEDEDEGEQDEEEDEDEGKKTKKRPQTEDVEPDEIEDESDEDEDEKPKKKKKKKEEKRGKDESEEQDEEEEEQEDEGKYIPPKDFEMRHLEKIHRAAAETHKEMSDRLEDLESVKNERMNPQLKRNLLRRLRKLRMAFGDFDDLNDMSDRPGDPDLRGRLRGLAKKVQRAKMIVRHLQSKHFHPGRMVLDRSKESDSDSDDNNDQFDDEDDDSDEFNQKLARLRAHYGEPMPGQRGNPLRAQLRSRIVALLRPQAVIHPFIPPPSPFPCHKPYPPQTRICKSTACPCGFNALHWSLVDGCYNVEGDCAPCGRNTRKIKAVGFSYSFNEVAQKRLPMFAFRRQSAPWNFQPRYKTTCPDGKVLVGIGAKVQDFGNHFKHQLRLKCSQGCPFHPQLPPMPNLVHVVRQQPGMIPIIRPLIRHRIVTMRPPPEIIHPIIKRILTPGVDEHPPPIIYKIIRQIVQNPRVVQHPIVRRIIRGVVQRPKIVRMIMQHPALIQRPVVRRFIQRPRIVMKVVKHPQIVHRIISHMIKPSQQQAIVVHHHHGHLQNLNGGVVHVLQHPVGPTHNVIIHGDQVGEESKKHKDESYSSSERAAFRKRMLPKIRKRLKGKETKRKSDSTESMKDDLHKLLLGQKTDA